MSYVHWGKPGAGGIGHYGTVTESGGCCRARPQQRGKILCIIRGSFIASFILFSLWLKFAVGTQLPAVGVILTHSGQSLGALETPACCFSQPWGLRVQGQGAGRAGHGEGPLPGRRRPASPCVFTRWWRERGLALWPLYTGTHVTREGHAHTTAPPPEGPASRRRRTGARFQPAKLGEGAMDVQSIVSTYFLNQ